MRWLQQHWAALSGIFLSALYVYLQLVVWKRHGDDLMLTAINIAVTSCLWVILLVAIGTYFQRLKKVAGKLKPPQLTEAVIQKIEKVGKLRSLAGRADYLVQILDDLYHQFVKSQKPMPYVLGINAVPDVIKDHLDKELWGFRDKYRSYLGSLKIVVPESDSDLIKEGFPCNGQEYPALKRKIEAHAAGLRELADRLLVSAKEENAKNQTRQ